MKCPICGANTIKNVQKFQSDFAGKIIEVPNIVVYRCTDLDCAMEWLPHEEEMKIDEVLELNGIESSRQRYLKKLK